MVVVDALHSDSAAAVADGLFGSGGDLQAFFDHAAPEVKATGGGEEGEEELEWLSNKDAFPAVETMAPQPRTKGVRRPRWEVAWSPPPPQAPVVPRVPVAGWRCRHCGTDRTPLCREGPEGRKTLCNACGVRYRSGRLVPEYRPASSPTFSPELHSNRHRCVIEMRRRRREAVARASLGAAGNGDEKGNGMLELLSNKGKVPTAAAARPRTKGTRRPRKAVACSAIAWSAPLPPRSPLVVGRRSSQGGGAGMADLQGRAPGDGGFNPTAPLAPPRTPPPPRRRSRHGGDAGAVGDGGAAADRGRPAPVAPAGGREELAAPQAPAVSGRQCRHCGTEKTPQWREGPEGRHTLCNACGVRYKSGRLVPEYRPARSPTFSPSLHSNLHRKVLQLRRRPEESTEVFPAAETRRLSPVPPPLRATTEGGYLL